MTTPSDHDINKLLADVAGVCIVWSEISNGWYLPSYADIDRPEWTPLTNHDQMALVKAGLQCNYSISVEKTPGFESTKVLIFDHPHCHTGWVETFDELRAMGEAIYNMMEARSHETAR